jgi:integrase
VGRVDIGRGANGKRRRRTVYGETREAAATKLNADLGEAADGLLWTTTTPTLEALLNDWFSTNQHKWRESTRYVYRYSIDKWSIPGLGTYRIEKLEPLLIQRWVNLHTRNGGRVYVKTARCVLHMALK